LSEPSLFFDEFELITARREIRRNGEAVSVEPKVYDLLLFLLERRDRTVGKEELQDAIWPNVIVTEAALTRCVMKARQVLGDRANRQKIIKTVHSHGYQFVAEVAESHTEQQHTGVEVDAGRRSIAVMPFINLSNDAEQEYLADGLTQDIVTDLSRNSWLFVIARNSTQFYKGKSVNHVDLGSALGAQYIVEGSVRKSGSNIRISAALIDIASGVSEWSERYDQPVADLFDIQDSITLGIASSLGTHVRRAEGKRALRADPAALDAWGLVHKGIEASWATFNRESNLQAEAIYRQALQVSPDNPRARAFLGCSVAMKVANGWSDAIETDRAESWSLGTRAVAESPEDAMIMINWGHTHTCLGKAAEAVSILQRALELDPSSAWGHGLLAFALTGAGRATEALEMVTEALRLSPRDAAKHWYLSMYAWAYLQLAQYEDAAREAQRAINAYRGWQVPWATLAVARAGLGQWEGAQEAAASAAALEERVDSVGFKRFFHFVVRDAEHAKRISDWLDRIWPAGYASESAK
jgi:TolB-like protein